MYNNNQNSGPPSFPSPQGGYTPGYSPQPGYGPPPGPPPIGFPSPSGYGPPPGPPGGYFPPSGPPPGQGYGPPSGPPPPQASRGFPGQQYHQQHSQPPPPPQQQYHAGYNPSYSSPAPPPPPNMSSRPYGTPTGAPHRPPTQQQNYGPHFEGANHKDAQPFFQYSQCNGKKKALCIGINYAGQKGELRGCINDANNIKRFICSRFGYKDEDIVMLTDDNRNPRQVPTRQNILQAMRWLVQGAQPNDSLFFHYSGHGGQTKDLDGDEEDGYDEVIYPLDHERAGHIVDDDIHDILVKPLPPGCRLTAIFDSCHSASALDLPYIYSTEGKVKEPNLAAEAGQGLLSAVTSYARGDMSGVFSSAMGLMKTVTGSNQDASKRAKRTKTSPADVISWSGCKDSQTSADTSEAGKATGAMSYAFMTCLNANSQQSYQQLLNGIRDILKAKYSQKPQLSSSHPMDTSLLFIA